MRIVRLIVVFFAITSILGISYYFVRRYQFTRVPLFTPEEKNLASAQARHQIWGTIFNFQLLEKLKEKDTTLLYLWNRGSFWTYTEFLELKIAKDKSMYARYFRYQGSPKKNGKVAHKAEFQIPFEQSEKILQVIESAHFWNSRYKGPDGLPCDVDRWDVEGIRDGSIVRGQSVDRDNAAAEAKDLSLRIRRVLKMIQSEAEL